MAIDITAGGYDLTPYISEIYTEKSISGDSPIGNAISEKLTLEIDSRRMTADEKAAAKTKNYTYNGKTFYLYSCPQRWTGVLKIELYDAMANVYNSYYSGDKNETIESILANIESIGATIDKSTLSNSTKAMTLSKSKKKVSGREWIAFIAEASGKNAYVSSGDVVKFYGIGETIHSLDVVYSYELIEQKKLGKVIYSDGDEANRLEGSGSPVEILTDNPFISSYERAEAVASILKGKKFWTINQMEALEPETTISVGDFVKYGAVKTGTTEDNIIVTSVKTTPGYGKARGIVELSSDLSLDSQINSGINKAAREKALDSSKLRDDYNGGNLGGGSSETGDQIMEKITGDQIIDRVNNKASTGKKFNADHLELKTENDSTAVELSDGAIKTWAKDGNYNGAPFILESTHTTVGNSDDAVTKGESLTLFGPCDIIPKAKPVSPEYPPDSKQIFKVIGNNGNLSITAPVNLYNNFNFTSYATGLNTISGVIVVTGMCSLTHVDSNGSTSSIEIGSDTKMTLTFKNGLLVNVS